MASPGRGGRRENSTETILTFDNIDTQSQWSVVWSTSHVPDNPTMGLTTNQRKRGRRRLTFGSLALSGLMTMHCRVAASALTGGIFIFMMFLVLAVVTLANPLRHFEVYLGQWSISGPGRAFRIIPMLDGIGIAMCIHTIVRAINCCAIAAITATYVINSVADTKLPFKHCRDFNLKPYDPVLKNLKVLTIREPGFPMETEYIEEGYSAARFQYEAWRNSSYLRNDPRASYTGECEETYPGGFPSLYSTTAYNYFYVELVHYRSDNSLSHFNIPLLLTLIVTWLILWFFMIMEKILHGKLIWNTMSPWFMALPWVWTLLLAATAASNLTLYKTIRKVFRVGAKEILTGLADAMEVSLYIHSVGVGTELIHGKGLNFFASGHIDNHLHGENVWHSTILLLLTGLHSGGTAMCALVDYVQPNSTGTYGMAESTLWILPLYSKCTSMSGYSHLLSTLVFGGMMISYMTVAFVLLKSALHTIFEYRVKLVFVQQIVVGILIMSCMALSVFYATNGGVALLESVNAIMIGVTTPIIALMELASLLYVYNSSDFQSDMRLATEENACSSRIGIQWQIIPFITLVALVMKISVIADGEMPRRIMVLAIIPLVAVILALPLRALHNAYIFLRPAPRQGA